jgi:hypothetical protein
MKNLILSFALIFSATSFASPIPGQVLLDVFSATCPSNGEWTQAALNDSRSLMAVIDAISKDEDCKSLGGALVQLSSLTEQVNQLASLSESKKQIAAYDAQERDLLMQISQSTNQLDIDNMNMNLRSIQMGRAGLIGRENAQRELDGTNTTLALSRAVQVADASFAQIAANQRCLEKAPGMLTTATGLVSSIGTAVATINPALGLGLTAGSSFVRSAVDQFRIGAFNRRIREVAEGSTAFMGYKCALETMSDRWCDMEDAHQFLDYKTRIRTNQLNQELRQAILLNDREIPVILDWLLKVKSGVAPQTTADGDRQRVAFARKATLEVLEAVGIAKINQSRAEYETVQAQLSERWALIRAIVNYLAPPPGSSMNSSSDVKSPFHDVYPSGYLPFFLIGVGEEDPSIRVNGSFIAIDNWTKPSTLNPDLETVRKNYNELVRLARIKVEREMSEVLRPDAGFTLATAYEIPGNEYKISPMTSLKNLITFLEVNPPNEDDRAFLRIYRGTLEKLKVIYDAVENAVLTDGLSVGDQVEKESLEKILMAADLTYGTVVIQARLELLVRISVMNLLEQSSPEDQVIVAQLLAADRFMDTLSTFTGKDDVGAIQEDILQAMSITNGNLNSFVKTFGKIINKQLQRLVKEENEAGPTVARLKRNDRAQFCYLLLSAEKVTQYVDVKLCEGMKLGPIAAGAPETKPLTAADFKKDLSERGCALHDYQRARKIFTQWSSRTKRLPVR